MRPAILLVDDDIVETASLVRDLETEFDVITARGKTQGIARMSGRPFLAIVSDAMPVLDEARARSPSSVRILVTGSRGLDDAADAVRSVAAHRFVLRPCAPTHLADTIQDALSDVEPQSHAPSRSTMRVRAGRVDLRWVVDDVMRHLQECEIHDVCLLAEIDGQAAIVRGREAPIRLALAEVLRAAALEARARTRLMHEGATWVWDPPVVSVEVRGHACRLVATVPMLGECELDAVTGAGGSVRMDGPALVVSFGAG